MSHKSNKEWSPSVEVGVLGLVLALITAVFSSQGDFNTASLAGFAFFALFIGNYIVEKLKKVKIF